ncbi:MAG: nuclease [Dehalococcoidia bacterium]|nr:nuclease [Dehalococcoidia bacterium]|tara:strand:- start:361 stop:687 length:327 start_codon:yes stop_codon:yes gene_type:complete
MYEYRAYVRKIYDGDTITADIDLGFGIVLHNQKIRLLRINAPEIRGEQREKGLVSRDALRNKISNKWIKVKTQKDKKGKYGRWLGELWLEEECINDWLVSEGLAEIYS